MGRSLIFASAHIVLHCATFSDWRDFRGEDEGRGAIVTVDDAALIRYGHAVPPRRRMRWRMKSRKYVNVFQAAARRWVAGSLNTVKRKEKILKVSVNVLQ